MADTSVVDGNTRVVCESCGTALIPVMSEETGYQFENALWIALHGGYGMFVDELEGGDDRLPGTPFVAAVICHECAHHLCDTVPWLNRLIKPHTSHSHNYRQPWGDHTGWDLPHVDKESE